MDRAQTRRRRNPALTLLEISVHAIRHVLFAIKVNVTPFDLLRLALAHVGHGVLGVVRSKRHHVLYV